MIQATLIEWFHNDTENVQQALNLKTLKALAAWIRFNQPYLSCIDRRGTVIQLTPSVAVVMDSEQQARTVMRYLKAG